MLCDREARHVEAWCVRRVRRQSPPGIDGVTWRTLIGRFTVIHAMRCIGSVDVTRCRLDDGIAQLKIGMVLVLGARPKGGGTRNSADHQTDHHQRHNEQGRQSANCPDV